MALDNITVRNYQTKKGRNNKNSEIYASTETDSALEVFDFLAEAF